MAHQAAQRGGSDRIAGHQMASAKLSSYSPSGVGARGRMDVRGAPSCEVGRHPNPTSISSVTRWPTRYSEDAQIASRFAGSAELYIRR